MGITSSAVFSKRAVAKNMEFAADVFSIYLGTGAQAFVERGKILFVDEPICISVFVYGCPGLIGFASFGSLVIVTVMGLQFVGSLASSQCVFCHNGRDITRYF